MFVIFISHCQFSGFWNHLKLCTRLIDSVCATVDQTNQSRVCCVLKVLATTHLSVRGWRELTSDLTTKIEDGVCLNEALLYIFDGIIPLVTSFCFEFDGLNSSGPSSKIFKQLLEKDDRISTLWKFAQSIQVCMLELICSERSCYTYTLFYMYIYIRLWLREQECFLLVCLK